MFSGGRCSPEVQALACLPNSGSTPGSSRVWKWPPGRPKLDDSCLPTVSSQNDLDRVKDSDGTIRQTVRVLVCLHHKDDCHCDTVSIMLDGSNRCRGHWLPLAGLSSAFSMQWEAKEDFEQRNDAERRIRLTGLATCWSLIL